MVVGNAEVFALIIWCGRQNEIPLRAGFESPLKLSCSLPVLLYQETVSS